LIALKPRFSTLAHFRHFKLQTYELQLLIEDSVQIKIRDRIYELEHLVAKKRDFNATDKRRTIMVQEILAPLDGTVSQLKIKAGDNVEEDEEIMVIEAMKMETPVFAPCDGIIEEVRVKEGGEVSEDDVLAIIDEG
jgi:acetyl-CoA carboxylase biotin carboxyl carrier protein